MHGVYQKEYLGTRSFPNTTEVTNSLEYSMASSLGKHRKELDYVKRTCEERKKNIQFSAHASPHQKICF